MSLQIKCVYICVCVTGKKLSDLERVTSLKVYNWFANRRKDIKRRANIGNIFLFVCVSTIMDVVVVIHTCPLHMHVFVWVASCRYAMMRFVFLKKQPSWRATASRFRVQEVSPTATRWTATTSPTRWTRCKRVATPPEHTKPLIELSGDNRRLMCVTVNMHSGGQRTHGQ